MFLTLSCRHVLFVMPATSVLAGFWNKGQLLGSGIRLNTIANGCLPVSEIIQPLIANMWQLGSVWNGGDIFLLGHVF